jgi:hypothetical protein
MKLSFQANLTANYDIGAKKAVALLPARLA